MLKYIRRLKNMRILTESKLKNPIGTENGFRYNYTALRSHGAPCSCSCCSHRKYDRVVAKRLAIEQINHDLNFWQSDLDDNDPMHVYYEKYSDIDIDLELFPGQLYAA